MSLALVRGAQTTGAHGPDAASATLVADLGLAVVEIIAGLRDPEQVRQWVDTATLDHLCAMHRRTSRRGTAGGMALERPAYTVLHARSTSPEPGVVEASAVIGDSRRARAVAMRLEAIETGWRATALRVL